MIRFGIMIGAGALVFAGGASAQDYGYPSNDEVYRNYTQTYQPRNTACEKQSKDDKLAGQIVGAVAGGLIGGAIGNNIDSHDDGYRYRRGYDRYDRRNRRHYDHRRSHKDDNDGEVIVGALLGAVVGGLAGGSIAEDTSSKCEAYVPARQVTYNGYNNRSDNYGRSRDYNTRRNSDYGARELYGGTAPAYPASRTYSTSARRTYTPQPAYGGRECRTVYRETRLPNGEIIRDPVQACRDNSNSQWRITDTSSSYNY